MKIMNSIAVMLATGAMLMLSAPVPSYSQMMDMPMNEYRGGYGQMIGMVNMDRMDVMPGICIEQADKIGLSDGQISKIRPIHREMQKIQARFKADLRIAEIELMEIMEVKDFDLEKASAGVKKISDIKTAYHLEMLKNMKEIRTILTGEQYEKLRSLMPMKTGSKKPVKKMNMKKQR